VRIKKRIFVLVRARKKRAMSHSRVVLSDSEEESEDERWAGQQNGENGSGESEEESDEEEIVYETAEDDLDKLERKLKKREPPRRADKKKREKKRPRYSSDEDDGDDDDDYKGSDSDSEEEDEGAYIPWEKLRRQYQNGERDEEPAGLTEHPQVHVPGWQKDGRAWTQAQKDALWASIRVKAAQPGFYAKWGVVATERQVGDTAVRIVHRTDYGTKFRKALKKYPMGSYMLGFIPTMVELFRQQPWQPFFDENDVAERTVPMPMFEDFEAAYHFDNKIDRFDLARMNEDEEDGPMWCLCTQCTKKGLENVTIMRHIPSGILVAVGGNCAAHMVGESRLDELIDFKLNGRSQYDVVGQMLGWS